jgi:hypothetical protein
MDGIEKKAVLAPGLSFGNSAIIDSIRPAAFRLFLQTAAEGRAEGQAIVIKYFLFPLEVFLPHGICLQPLLRVLREERLFF